MAFTPLHDRVVVRRLESDEKTAGGLIIPDNAKEKPAEGKVVAVGAGAKDDNGERIPSARKAATSSSTKAFGAPRITKDGVTVAKEVELEGQVRKHGRADGEGSGLAHQ